MSSGIEGMPDLPAPMLRLLDAGREAERVGQRDRARSLFERLLHAIGGGAGDAAFAAALVRWIGRSHFDDGDLDAAGDCFEVALAIGEAIDDEACAAHAVNLMAIISWRRGQLEEAERLYLRARDLGVRGGDAKLVAMIEQNLGIIANIHGDLPCALERYTASLAGYRALGLTRYVAPVLNNLGMLYTDQRRWRAAQRAFSQAVDVSITIGDVGTRIMVEVNRAELWIARKDFRRARDACDTARRLMTESGDLRGIAETHKHYGVIAREQRRFDEAADHFARAMAAAEQTQDRLLTAETALEQAELYSRMRRNSETLHWLTHAYRLFTEMHASREIADVGARLERLEAIFISTVREWGDSIESKDRYTRGHCERVAEYACALAGASGFDEERLFWFRLGAFLHDVGKIVVPSEILNKAGRLTDEERSIVQRHPLAGVELLSETDFPFDIVPMVRSHHEHWDGGGYPDGLCGEDIPLAARILCVADVYDALTTDRPYRRGHDHATAIQIMADDVGRVFDPRLFAAFVGVAGGMSRAVQLHPVRRISVAIRARQVMPTPASGARSLSA